MNFQQAVIERSQELPVVVDFWASWCGPCRVLGPVIEQLAAESAGSWELVKISTEEYPELAQQYEIMSIPAVKMFYQGEVVAEFFGALPRPQIERWLEENLPSEEKEAFAAVQAELTSGNRSAGLDALEQFVANHPQMPEAHTLLAKELIFADPERAASLLENSPLTADQLEAREDLDTLLRLSQWDTEEDTAVVRKLKAAQQALQNHDQEAAIKLLVEAVMIDKKYADDLPRKACIAFFRTIWGHDHPMTKKHRISFDMALY